MDLTLWFILLVLIFIAIQMARAVSFLGKISSSNDIAIKCLDAHELLLRKVIEENEQQGVAIEEIRNLMQNK